MRGEHPQRQLLRKLIILSVWKRTEGIQQLCRIGDTREGFNILEIFTDFLESQNCFMIKALYNAPKSKAVP